MFAPFRQTLSSWNPPSGLWYFPEFGRNCQSARSCFRSVAEWPAANFPAGSLRSKRCLNSRSPAAQGSHHAWWASQATYFFVEFLRKSSSSIPVTFPAIHWTMVAAVIVVANVTLPNYLDNIEPSPIWWCGFKSPWWHLRWMCPYRPASFILVKWFIYVRDETAFYSSVQSCSCESLPRLVHKRTMCQEPAVFVMFQSCSHKLNGTYLNIRISKIESKASDSWWSRWLRYETMAMIF